MVEVDWGDQVKTAARWFSDAQMTIESGRWNVILGAEDIRTRINDLIPILNRDVLRKNLPPPKRKQLSVCNKKLQEQSKLMFAAHRTFFRELETLRNVERRIIDSVLTVLLEIMEILFPIQNEFDWRPTETTPEDFYFG
jgi:hypothetical protein